jgi:hypothetical protein
MARVAEALDGLEGSRREAGVRLLRALEELLPGPGDAGTGTLRL